MKRKGMALTLEAVIVLLIIAIVAAGSFFAVIGYENHNKIERQRELESIRIALLKYAHNHRGVTEPDGGFKLITVTHSFDLKDGSVEEQESTHLTYEAPGLFPKDLNELVEFGYLPASFRGVLTGADSDYVSEDYIKFDNYSESAPAAKVYGTGDGKIVYRVFPDPNMKADDDGNGIAMYTKCTLKYEEPKFSIGPWTLTLSRTKIRS